MNTFLKYLLTLLLLSIAVQGFAQLDNSHGKKNKGKLPLKILPTAPKKDKSPQVLIPNNDKGFKTAYRQNQKKIKQQQKKQAIKNQGILTKAQIAAEHYNKNFKLINGKYPKIDQDLGSFRSESKFVTIICRDFQSPDGDRVAIYHNGVAVVRNIVLQSSFQSFKIWLNKGINKFSFMALNQGSSGPNTAAFKVYDDTSSLVCANQWNLATGAKATIIIAKGK